MRFSVQGAGFVASGLGFYSLEISEKGFGSVGFRVQGLPAILFSRVISSISCKRIPTFLTPVRI